MRSQCLVAYLIKGFCGMLDRLQIVLLNCVGCWTYCKYYSHVSTSLGPPTQRALLELHSLLSPSQDRLKDRRPFAKTHGLGLDAPGLVISLRRFLDLERCRREHPAQQLLGTGAAERRLTILGPLQESVGDTNPKNSRQRGGMQFEVVEVVRGLKEISLRKQAALL